MARRRRRTSRSRARLGRALWLLGGTGTLVVGLAVGAHLFDEPDASEPARSLEAPSGEQAVPPASWDRIRVEVLNAGGLAGMAGRATDRLRERGFDVVYYGNAASFGLDSTRVLARTGSLEAARAVAGVLGAGTPEADPDSGRFVDVTVLLGTDWSGETEGTSEPSESVEGGEPWWDVRRLFQQR